MNSFDKIYEIVRQIPYGRVSTYGRVAFLAGNPRWSRVVGYAMRACSDSSVPCHRVLMKDGSVSGAFQVGGENLQYILLSDEGVSFGADGKADMKKFVWP